MKRFICAALLLAALAPVTHAEPAGLAYMDSSAEVTLSNWTRPPHNRWALKNAGILSTLMLPRGGQVYHFPKAQEQDLSSLSFDYEGKAFTVLQSLEQDQTDGIIVLKNGHIIWEAYYDGFGPKDHHLWASGTKSLIGMATGILVERGQIDLQQKVSHYLPELAQTGWSRATVQDTLNMSSALDYQETMTQSQAGSIAFEYFKRIGLLPAFDLMQLKRSTDETPRGVRQLLKRFKSNDAFSPGEKFEYHSPNVDVMAWLIERVSGQKLRQFLSEEVWAKLQTEHDAFITADASFTPIATGGMNTTLRDFARFGAAVMNDGVLGAQRVFPKAWVRSSTQVDAATVAATKKSVYKQPGSPVFDPHLLAYKNFWWLHDQPGVFTARGIYGQNLYFDRSSNVLIATFASARSPSNAARSSAKRKMLAFKAMAEHLR